MSTSNGVNGGVLPELQEIFLQNVSHELRTPLNVMMGFAELLRDGSFGELTGEQMAVVSRMCRTADEMHVVVERIGILLGTVAAQGVPEPANLGDAVAAACYRRGEMAVTGQVTLSLELADGLPPIAADPDQLRHMVDCLVDNAVKFTPAGGEVSVRTYAEPGWACLAVSDTGIGIEAAQQRRIFDRFYQVDGSSTRCYGGLGLGLAVVKETAAALGGQVEVYSRPGAGSSFVLRLPAIGAARGTRLRLRRPLVNARPARAPWLPAAGRPSPAVGVC